MKIDKDSWTYIIMLIVAGIFVIIFTTFVIQYSFNHSIKEVFDIKEITFSQALLLGILCKILCLNANSLKLFNKKEEN